MSSRDKVYKDRKMKNNHLNHQDNKYIYNTFCKNDCKNNIKMVDIIKFEFGKTSKIMMDVVMLAIILKKENHYKMVRH